MLVGAQIVDLEPFCPGFFGGGFAVEEEDVGFKASPARTALGIEDAGGQTQQGVNVRLFE